MKNPHKHHIIPVYHCKELGIDPDFEENYVMVERLDHARIHWGYKCDDLEPLFEYITPEQWIIDLIPRGDTRDAGAAILNARGEIEGWDAPAGPDHFNRGRKRPDLAEMNSTRDMSGKKNSSYKHGKLVGARNNKEIKAAYDKEWRLTPERKRCDLERQQTPEYKERAKEFDKKRRQKPEYKAYMAAYRAKHIDERRRYDRERAAKKKAERQGEGTLEAYL